MTRETGTVSRVQDRHVHNQPPANPASRKPRERAARTAVCQVRDPLRDDGAPSEPRNPLPILAIRWAFHSPGDQGPHLFDFPQRPQEWG